MNIYEDFVKVKKHLQLPDKLPLLIDPGSTEGICLEKEIWDLYPDGIIKIGVKDGYSRRLLVHECVHATGLGHLDKPGYESVIRHDTYSAGIEREIFDKACSLRDRICSLCTSRQHFPDKCPDDGLNCDIVKALARGSTE
jgi:hypothetical protein